MLAYEIIIPSQTTYCVGSNNGSSTSNCCRRGHGCGSLSTAVVDPDNNNLVYRRIFLNDNIVAAIVVIAALQVAVAARFAVPT
jgi:hypothetical protein